MKVFVVTFYDVVIGVYSSLAASQSGVKECDQRFGCEGEVEEFELDATE